MTLTLPTRTTARLSGYLLHAIVTTVIACTRLAWYCSCRDAISNECDTREDKPGLWFHCYTSHRRWPRISHTWSPAGLGMRFKSAYHRLRIRCYACLHLACWLEEASGLSISRCPEPVLSNHYLPRRRFLDQPLGQLPIPTPRSHPRRQFRTQGIDWYSAPADPPCAGVMGKAPRRVVKRFRCTQS